MWIHVVSMFGSDELVDSRSFMGIQSRNNCGNFTSVAAVVRLSAKVHGLLIFNQFFFSFSLACNDLGWKFSKPFFFKNVQANFIQRFLRVLRTTSTDLKIRSSFLETVLSQKLQVHRMNKNDLERCKIKCISKEFIF